MSLFRTLQEYLLRLEYILWGLLDGGWQGVACYNVYLCVPSFTHCRLLCITHLLLPSMHASMFGVA